MDGQRALFALIGKTPTRKSAEASPEWMSPAECVDLLKVTRRASNSASIRFDGDGIVKAVVDCTPGSHRQDPEIDFGHGRQCEKKNLRRSRNSNERKTAHEPALGM